MTINKDYCLEYDIVAYCFVTYALLISFLKREDSTPVFDHSNVPFRIWNHLYIKHLEEPTSILALLE